MILFFLPSSFLEKEQKKTTLDLRVGNNVYEFSDTHTYLHFNCVILEFYFFFLHLLVLLAVIVHVNIVTRKLLSPLFNHVNTGGVPRMRWLY